MKPIVLSIMLSLLTVISASAYDLQQGGFCYNYLSDSEVEVTFDYIDYKTQTQSFYWGDIKIPETIKVNETKDYTVTKIGKNAFYYSKYLTSVSIPATVTEICSNAFGECKALTSIKIEDGDDMLCTDYYIAIGYIPVFTGSPIKDLYVGRPCYPQLLSDLESLENVTFRNSLTDIPRISNAPKLTSISLPSNAEIIGGFPKTGISQISLPATVKEIYIGAFCDTKLSAIELPDGLLSIGEESFSDCAISEITIPATCLSFARALSFSNLETIKILAPISKINAEDFKCCEKLKTISIPSTFTTIEHNAFEGCSSLESFIIPNSVETLEYETFIGCSALKSITIGNKVNFIGNESFKDCNSLESVTCLGYEAPLMIKSAFDDSTYQNATLYYNETSIWYTSDQSVWNNFVKKVPIDPESASVDSINFDSSAYILNYTNPQGITSKSPFKGFNIIRYSNGNIKKIFINN